MRDVLFVTIDALRRDHVSAYGHHRETTPHLDALAHQGARRDCLANHPGTRWAFQSLMAGVYTLQIDGVGLPDAAGTTLPEVFQARGYTTAGFANNTWLSKLYNYDRGFDHFMGGMTWDRVRQTDRETVSRALEWIGAMEADGEDWFCWVHLMDPHGPWSDSAVTRAGLGIDQGGELPEDGHDLVEQGEDPPQQVLDAYDVAVRSADEQLGRLVAGATKHRDPLIVATADHGEEFGRWGDFHEASCYPSMTDVPLVTNQLGLLDKGAHQHVDLPPILTEYAGLEAPESWVGDTTPTYFEPAPAFLCVRDQVGGETQGGERVVLHTDRTDEVLYPPDRDAVSGPPRRFIQDALAFCADNQLGTAQPAEQDELSDEARSRLRELGYLGGDR